MTRGVSWVMRGLDLMELDDDGDDDDDGPEEEMMDMLRCNTTRGRVNGGGRDDDVKYGFFGKANITIG
jgi:hypothetical protein